MRDLLAENHEARIAEFAQSGNIDVKYLDWAEWGMSPKQLLFCLIYLTNGMNARQAALRAGYSHPAAGTATTWIDRKPQIKNYIQAWVKDMCMSNHEVLAHITDLARGGFMDIAISTRERKLGKTNYTVQDLVVNIEAAKQAGVMGQVKKIRQTRNGIEVEVFDRLKAQELLARAKGMLMDKVIVEDWRKAAIASGLSLDELESVHDSAKEAFVERLLQGSE